MLTPPSPNPRQRDRRDPLCSLERSDSANLDAVFENQIRYGKTPAHAIAVLVPEAFRNQPVYDPYPEIVDMLEYYEGLQEVRTPARRPPSSQSPLSFWSTTARSS